MTRCRIIPLRSLLAALLLILMGACPSLGQDKKDVYTDPKDAGPSYALQGEYEGKFGEAKMGAQIVALGDDKFDLVLYHGGLPGDAGGGWKKGDKREKASGALAEGVVTFKGEASPVLKEGSLTFDRGVLKKIERKSPTLGAKPPQGAVVLFDGKTNDFINGETTEDGYLMALGKGGQKSKYQFKKSFAFHLEFRTPFQPKARGQGRGNSGVFLPGIPEIQVLDSFGLEGKGNEAGGFYPNREPDVNMAFPPLTWQTYDVEMTMAQGDKESRVIVKHNGVVIHDQPASFKGGGGLNLQNHGNPVVYRNIWVVEK
ncbi:MAG: DUF1080 domain-containing protein [Phycisphaeraceae bacterium]